MLFYMFHNPFVLAGMSGSYIIICFHKSHYNTVGNAVTISGTKVKGWATLKITKLCKLFFPSAKYMYSRGDFSEVLADAFIGLTNLSLKKIFHSRTSRYLQVVLRAAPETTSRF